MAVERDLPVGGEELAEGLLIRGCAGTVGYGAVLEGIGIDNIEILLEPGEIATHSEEEDVVDVFLDVGIVGCRLVEQRECLGEKVVDLPADLTDFGGELQRWVLV